MCAVRGEGIWTGVSRAPARGAGAAGGHFVGSRRGRGPRDCLLRARFLVGLGPYAAPRPRCVGAPALAGCGCLGAWGHRWFSHVGVLLCGLVVVLCWCSGHVWRLVRGRASMLGEARGLAWLWCVAARLMAVSAGCPGPGRGSGCGRWWVLSWRVVCGVSRDGAGGGVGVRSRRGAVTFLCR